jgi:sphingomyelin phosphodiesterase
MNMNYCTGANFWLYINATDPLNQLAWLANVLQESELKEEKVHIIGHIHPESCFYSWSAAYYRIVNRYESTIAGQFFGHSHYDLFRMFYDLEDLSRAISVIYVAGSVTTSSFLNPGFRIYTVDGNYANSSWQVLDHDNYFLNLTEANLSLNATWAKAYSAKVYIFYFSDSNFTIFISKIFQL